MGGDDRFAGFRIERELGRGGMGVVYLAGAPVGAGELAGAPVGVGRAPTGLAAGDGAIWVANTADGTVVRLDPDTGARIGDPIRVGREPVAVTMDQYSAWIADAAGSVRQLALQDG
jgi:streptogramin lyase